MFSLPRSLPTLRRRLFSKLVITSDVTSNRHASLRPRPRRQVHDEDFIIDESTASTYMDLFNASSKPISSKRAKKRKPKLKAGMDNRAAKDIEAFLEGVRSQEEEIRTVQPERPMYTFRTMDIRSDSLFGDVETSVRMRRLTTLRRVQRVIDQNFYNGPRYKVETFGSTRNGLSSSESDLDIIVLDPERPNGFPGDEDEKLPGIYNARRLGSLFHRAGFTEIETIPWAATPIVKFKDPVTSMHCDLNINERLGAINSDLISTYCDILPPLRPMLRSIKSWAKSRNLNNPSPQGKHPRSFSSYSLVIMTLGFLQIRGYLPNLQASLPDKEDHRLQFWIRRPQPLLCDYRFFTQPPPGWKLPDIPPLEGILRDWFRFWGVEFDYNGQMLSISRGGIVKREQSWGRESLVAFRNAPLRVIDPFIPTKNLVVSVAPRELERFVEECGAMVHQE